MMKNWLVFVLMVSLLGLFTPTADAAKKKGKKPQPAPPKTFQQYDKDGDGSVAVREFTADLKGKRMEKATLVFNKMDKNTDGALSPDEFKLPEKKKNKKNA